MAAEFGRLAKQFREQLHAFKFLAMVVRIQDLMLHLYTCLGKYLVWNVVVGSSRVEAGGVHLALFSPDLIVTTDRDVVSSNTKKADSLPAGTRAWLTLETQCSSCRRNGEGTYPF